VLPGLRSPPLCAGQPRRRDESRAESCEGMLALAALWPSPTCGMAAAAASGSGPGEKSQHTERAATLATGLRTLPSSFSLGEVGGDPLLLSPGWASCPVSSRNAAPLRPTRSRSRRVAGQSPQRPHFNASRPPAQLVRFVASIPKAAEELRQPLLLAVCFGFRLDCLQAPFVRSALWATIGPRPEAAPRALTADLFFSRNFFNRLDWHRHSRPPRFASPIVALMNSRINLVVLRIREVLTTPSAP